MKNRPIFDFDEERPDFFVEADTTDNPDATPEAGQTLSFGDEGPKDEPRPKRRRWRRFLTWLIVICIVALGLTIYLRYYNPYVTDSRISGYITKVERRGIIFKTYEAEVISEAALTDTTRLYSERLTMSIPSGELAAKLQTYQGSGQRVTLTTERFWGMLPWRGESTTVITDVETPSDPIIKILQ